MKTHALKALAAAAALAACGTALADITIGVIAPLTGPASGLGIPVGNEVKLWPKEIAGEKLNVILMDDASDPTQGVTNAKRFVSQDKVDVIMGSVATPVAAAIAQVATESQTTQIAWSPVALPPGKDHWVFRLPQSNAVMGYAVLEHMKKQGIKSVGFLGYSDAYGETWLTDFKPMAEKAGIKFGPVERFARADTSVTGQALKLMSAKPDAILVVASGSGAAMPEMALRERGYKGKIYQTHGAALPAFIKLGGKKVEGTIMAASLMLVLPEIADSNPSKKVATQYIDEYKKVYGEAPATFGANVYDAGLLLAGAVPKAEKAGKPGTKEFRAALRDALEQTKELVGTQGVYNMTPQDHSGFDARGRELITIKDGQFKLLK